MMGGRSNSCWGWRRWRWWRGAWTWTDSSSVSSLFQESEDADPCRASCHVSQHQAGHALVFIAALLKFSSQLDASVTHSSVTTSRSVSALLNSKRWNINTPPLPCVPRPSLRAGSFYGRSEEEEEAPSGTRTCSLFNAPPQGEILQQLQLPVGAAGIVIFKRCQSWDITGGRLSGGLLGRTPAATPAELLGRTSRTSRSARVNKHTGRSRQRPPPLRHERKMTAMNDALCCYALQTLTCTLEVMSAVMSAAGEGRGRGRGGRLTDGTPAPDLGQIFACILQYEKKDKSWCGLLFVFHVIWNFL